MKKIKILISNPLFSGSLIMFGGSMVANVINQLYHIVMGKMLSIESYGTLATIFSVLYIVSIVPSSTSISIVKFISAAKDKSEVNFVYHGINKFLQKIAFIGALILLLFSPLLSSFLHIQEIVAVILVAPIFYFSIITLMNQATAQGRLRFVGFVIPIISNSVTKLVFGILFVYLGWAVTGAVWGVLISMTLGYFISRIFVADIKNSNKNNFKLKPFLKYSAPALLQALSFTSLFTVDLILVKHFLTSADAGAYAALSLFGKVIYFASSPITSVMFPIVSGRKARGEAYAKVFGLALLMNITISLGAILIYALIPKLLITTLYQESYASAAGGLVWMGLFMGVYTAVQFLVNYGMSIGKTKIGILPAIAAIAQIGGIVIWHESIFQVIQVSLAVVTILLLAVILKLRLYNTEK